MENNSNGSGTLTIFLGLAGLIGGALVGACLESTSKGQQMNQTLNDSCRKASSGYKKISYKGPDHA